MAVSTKLTAAVAQRCLFSSVRHVPSLAPDLSVAGHKFKGILASLVFLLRWFRPFLFSTSLKIDMFQVGLSETVIRVALL